ncbi:hypothetical protein ACP275_03G037400 [Erythranthe tilingii]
MSSNQPKRLKNNTIHAFFQSNKKESSTSNVDSSSLDHEQECPEPAITPVITAVGVMLNQEFDINSLEHDPGKIPQIWMYPVEKQDEIRRTYIKLGPYQFYLPEYSYSGIEGNRRRFQYSWFSPTKDAAYCLSCFIYGGRISKLEESHNSQHCASLKSCEDLMNQSAHIDKVMQRQPSVEILNNRLRLKTSIDCARWLAYQSCSFPGHDEGPTSKNSGNFREMVKLLANYNEKYISPTIQKEILHIIASKVRNIIREDIDESKKEQMALVLRFVDKIGVLQECLFDIVSVKDTTSLTLKHELPTIFCHDALSIDNLRGQGYDSASNMRGELNGLQSLFLKDCSYAYYIHCFAHRLQLALVAASRELDSFVNIVGASCKRTGELITAQQAEISHLISINELGTGSGANQIGNLQRAGNTRWGSHFSSVCSWKKMFSATGSVLQTIISDGANYSQRGDADSAYTAMTSFQIMGVTDVLCQTLQQRSQDILNAMNLVSTTKQLLQNLRDDGWDSIFNDVNLFCQSNEVDVRVVEMPDMNSIYKVGRGKSIHQPRDTNITMEHHFHFDIFVTTIDTQMEEFNEQTMELLTLSCALDPSDSFKSFKVDDICTLVDKYYPADFTEQDRLLLKFQLQQYHLDMTKHQDLCHLSTLAPLCEGLTETGKSKVYYLVDRLIRFILLLPLTKTRIRSKMEDGFLGDCMLLHIERDIADLFSTYSIIDEFYSKKKRRAQLK